MIGFRDMTFCSYKECKKFKSCHRALTEEVKKGIEEWLPGKGYICQFSEKPKCCEE